MKRLYKIGDISRLYGISNDILRHYEKIGLLIPDTRGENGYRYYSEKQLWKLNNIRSLRSLGLGLGEIIDFLNNRSVEKTKEMIDFQLEKINENLEKLLNLKKELELKKENIRYYEKFSQYEKIEVIEIPRRYILLKRGSFKEESEINLELKKLKRKSDEDNDFIFSESEIGTIIRFDDWNSNRYYNYSGTFIITKDKTENYIEAGRYLTYFFCGDYDKMDEHYTKIKDYIGRMGYKVCGNIIELYHIEMHITENKSEYVTEIQIPLEKI